MTKPEGGKGPYFAANFGGSCQVVRVNGDGNSVYGWLFSIEDGPFAADLANSAYAAGFKAGRAGRDNLREALERSRMAIDDWLHSYAPEFCDEDSVAQTRSRISEKGTIGYISDVQKQNYETLSADEEAGK